MVEKFLFALSLTLLLSLLSIPCVHAVDGVCSSVNGTYITVIPDNSTLCVGGPPSGMTVLGPDYTWVCYHVNGSGNNAYCMAHFVLTLPGTCGKARHLTFNDQSLLSDDNEMGNVCLYGTPSKVALVGTQFQWNCYGTGGGAMVNCTAVYESLDCDGHKDGDKWTQPMSENGDISQYCTYGPGNVTIVINSTISLTCSGGVATVTQKTITSTTYSGVCAPVPTTSISVLGNWDTDPYLGGFSFVQKVRNDSLYAFPSLRSAHGQGVARVQVSLGDDPINSSGERAEVVSPHMYGTKQAQYETNTSGTAYFGLTYMFPTGFGGRNYGGGWSIVCQLHGPDTFGLSPSVALAAGFMQAGGSLGFIIDGTGGFLPNGTHGSMSGYYFSSQATEPIILNRWVEFIMEVTFSVYSTNGSITLYRRNEGEKGFRLAAKGTGATLQTWQGYSVGTHYWKQGLYRQKGDNRTDTHYMGPFVRGLSFADVELAAFGTQYGVQTYAPESDTFTQPGSSTSGTNGGTNSGTMNSGTTNSGTTTSNTNSGTTTSNTNSGTSTTNQPSATSTLSLSFLFVLCSLAALVFS